MSVQLQGGADDRYGRVVDAFARAFDGRETMGAALAIRVDGRLVVDVWAGSADAESGRSWAADTPSVIFSCTKGLVSILVAQLVEEGVIDYDDAVAEYWPEYATHGKEATTIAHLLSHRAGLPAPRRPWSTSEMLSWEHCVSALQEEEPFWPPGERHAYHPITHGWLIGEVMRRVTGQSVGHAFNTRIASRIGDGAWIGLPADVEPLVASMEVGPSLADHTATLLADANPWPATAMTLGGALPAALVGDQSGFNDPRVHAAEIPGAGGIATARALATIWSATVTETDGVRLLGDALRERAVVVQSKGQPFFDAPAPWAAWGMGFQLDSEARRYLTPNGFGHDGAGGQVAFADPELGVGLAFLTNLMEAGDERGTLIVDELREVLS